MKRKGTSNMNLFLLLQLKRIRISIQWIFLKADRFPHLSVLILCRVYTLDGKTYEVTKPDEIFDEALDSR